MNHWYREEHFIDGVWVPGTGDKVPVENPATGSIIGSSAHGTEDEVQAAVAAAQRALVSWRLTSARERQQTLLSIAEQLQSRTEELVGALVAELGSPRHAARDIHVAATVADLQTYAQEVTEIDWTAKVDSSTVHREALGVIGCITPWNYPTHQMAAKVGAAIAAGCTVVLKPAELTPLSAYIFAEAIASSTLPAGVVNIVFGLGRTTGDALVRAPGVDGISFTGSTEVGRSIASVGGSRLVPVFLELGGKSASVVLDDADLEEAVRWTVRSATVNSGQTCSACTRMIVPKSRAADAVAIATRALDALVVGDPSVPTVDLGPVSSRAQQSKVQQMLKRASDAGAIIHSATLDSGLRGAYCAPTLVTGVANSSEIVQEEIFGPVLVVQEATDDDHAVELANGTRYGLSGAVWSADAERAKNIARRMHTGQVDINGADWNLRAPFGGVKESGHGRELGSHGITDLTVLKSIQQ